MKKKWQIIIYTASHKSYADAILDELDPEGTLIDGRLYRHNCRELLSDFYVKDLSQINRDLKDVVLVDNSTYSYSMQIDNGIPIIPYYQGKDYQLHQLENYLNQIVGSDDLRKTNKEYFQLSQYNGF